jgi:hypothetical protein
MGNKHCYKRLDLLVVDDVPSRHLTSLHKTQYNNTLLNRQEFTAGVKQGSIIEDVYAPMRKEDMLQCAFDTGDLKVDPDAIETSLEERQAKYLEKAEGFWLKGNGQPACKILRHILQAKVLCNYLILKVVI